MAPTPFKTSMASIMKSFPLQSVRLFAQKQVSSEDHLRSFFEHGIVEFPLYPVSTTTSKVLGNNLQSHNSP